MKLLFPTLILLWLTGLADSSPAADFSATLRHIMGPDHERSTFYHNGLERRLTNVHGHVVKEVLV